MDLARGIADHARSMVERCARVLVAIDGPDAAGKTTLADGVAASLEGLAVRASIDDFHRPAVERRARGLTAEAYLDDTFAFDDVELLLQAFAGGTTSVVTGVLDLATDRVSVRHETVPEAAVLVMDGVFLLRRELRRYWDVGIHLHVPEEVTLERALVRDRQVFGDAARVEERYRRKYLPGQALYRSREDPWGVADVVADTSDVRSPVVTFDRIGLAGRG
ncbi:uridine kinase [Jiangella asiatica]|uniref:Uridine kinase n=1 Tax=Jiangella asiatica TaxID=2530372 RepID=A0A4R5DJK0_9ACTN|nr:uridine kinase [Jiangella asiatica]TDE14312.1 uridine kinase [Jiangella asiatica]